MTRDFWREHRLTLILSAVAVACFLGAFSPMAFGQEALTVSPEPSTVVSFAWVLDLVAEYIVPALVTLVMAIFGWLARRAGKLLGVQIDTDRNAALQAAIERGLQAAVNKLKDSVGSLEVDVKSRLIAEAARYVENNMRGTLQHFGIDADQLTDLVSAKVDEWQVTAVTRSEPPPAAPASAS